MRISFPDPDWCQRLYESTRTKVEKFEFRRQSNWYSQANALMRLARISYALGHPVSECRSWFRTATDAYRELFSLRGTTVTKHTPYTNGKPLQEVTITSDGYTSVDSYNAALASLAVGDLKLARELVDLAGDSPNAALVSPSSQVCTTNEQTLSHALNALLKRDMPLALREAKKLSVRRAAKFEKQTALVISAIAESGDVASELETLLFFHEKLATSRRNEFDISLWLCLPALGLSFMGITLGECELGDLTADNAYCPTELLTIPGESSA